jgi:hypothetical protein
MTEWNPNEWEHIRVPCSIPSVLSRLTARWTQQWTYLSSRDAPHRRKHSGYPSLASNRVDDDHNGDVATSMPLVSYDNGPTNAHQIIMMAKLDNRRRANGEQGTLHAPTILAWMDHRIRLDARHMGMAVMYGLISDTPHRLMLCGRNLDLIIHVLEEAASHHQEHMLIATRPVVVQDGVAQTLAQARRSHVIMESMMNDTISKQVDCNRHQRGGDRQAMVMQRQKGTTPGCEALLKTVDELNHIDSDNATYSAEPGSNPRVCIQCQESTGEDVQFMFIPCMHRCLCGGCIKTYQASVYAKKCPVCNATADHIMQTF